MSNKKNNNIEEMDLTKLSKTELLEMCQKVGIKNCHLKKKTELITLLHNTPVDNITLDNTPGDNITLDNITLDNKPVDNIPGDKIPVDKNIETIIDIKK